MTLYCGIDLHSNNVMISIIDDNDKLISEQRLNNNLNSIIQHLNTYQSQLGGIVVESTYNWYWLIDGLMDQGYLVHLANTLAIQQYNSLKYTNDATDARFLAHLLRLNILPTGYIYPKERRSVRDLLRRRLLLVEQRTAQILSLQSMITRHSSLCLSSDKIKRLQSAQLNQYFTQAAALHNAKLISTLIKEMTQHIVSIETFVERACLQTHSLDYQLLTSIPGIGKILGLTILLETGPIQRFKKVGHYSSYARCVPTEKISNSKIKGRGNKNNGNKYLAKAFVEAAHYASIWDKSIKKYYQRKCKKVPTMVAKKTVANKLTRACYHMLNEHTAFDASRAFG